MQQQSAQTGQTKMTQPPAVITTKDHLYLKDMMSWNLTAMKKAYDYAQRCQEQDVQNVLQETYRMHERHYQICLQHCKNPSQA